MKGLVIGLAALLALPCTANAAAFINGDFESGIDPGVPLSTYDTSGSGIDGWFVTQGTVDYIGTYWTAGSGSRSLDLNGRSQGGIAQTFDTVVGQTYAVAFLLAGNPLGGPALKSVEVGATGNAAQQYSFNTTGYSVSDLGWTEYSYVFTAAGALTTLSFNSLVEGGYYGPALDRVSLSTLSLPVPEPATWALLFAGFALVGGALRSRTQSIQFS